MLSHEEMVGLQAEKHQLIDVNNFRSTEEYVLHLIHSFAYIQAASLSKDKKVLDLGCNTGYGTEILSRSAKMVVGVDVSNEAISIAKKSYGNLGIEFHLIDGKQLPFDDKFDLIISCQVIEHIVDYSIYLNELKRVLSPTGIVVFTTPNASLRLDPGMKPWNKFHVREFTHTELEELLKKHFSSLKVMGLFAEESIYMIEKNRLTTARDIAREKQQCTTILAKISRKLKRLCSSSAKKNNGIDKAFIDQYGFGDLYYRKDKLETALDFLAICTSDVSAMKEIEQKLKMD